MSVNWLSCSLQYRPQALKKSTFRSLVGYSSHAQLSLEEATWKQAMTPKVFDETKKSFFAFNPELERA